MAIADIAGIPWRPLSISYDKPIKMLLFYAILANKQNAEGVSSAVGGNSAACAGRENFIEAYERFNLFDCGIQNFLVNARVGNENACGILSTSARRSGI